MAGRVEFDVEHSVSQMRWYFFDLIPKQTPAWYAALIDYIESLQVLHKLLVVCRFRFQAVRPFIWVVLS